VEIKVQCPHCQSTNFEHVETFTRTTETFSYVSSILWKCRECKDVFEVRYDHRERVKDILK
jgi:transposase-like protein